LAGRQKYRLTRAKRLSHGLDERFGRELDLRSPIGETF
jgi:hypothetical protein